MDPLADKLLIVAALISLVSLHRLAAWVAMVIITRELAVTVLRLGATQAGVVMAASMFGKVKTCLQIAADPRDHRRARAAAVGLGAAVRDGRSSPCCRALTTSSGFAAACSRRRARSPS